MSRVNRKQDAHVSRHPSTTKRALLRAKDYHLEGRLFKSSKGIVNPIDPKRVSAISSKDKQNKASVVFFNVLSLSSKKKTTK